MEIRKILTIVEETEMEMGKKVEPTTRRAAAIAVIRNPFAGYYQDNPSELIEIGEKLGDLLGKKALEAEYNRRKSRELRKRSYSWRTGRIGACRCDLAS